MGKKNKKNRVGVVFSTDSDYDYKYKKDEEEDTLPKKGQRLRVVKDSKGRKGKVVTLLQGYVGSSDDKNKLCKLLKTKCGVGGSLVEEGILIQGDQRDKVVGILKKEGYEDVKKSGG